ncbi:uncharacterized protein LOC142638028 [Castanea sativa]|uniref:uncharacterized protein LOC142638028 n=1 Tax=Castanea sativa TaxID=21020 RepID=UPI003F64BCDD
MMTFTPPTTCSKGKGKVGKNVWEDPTIALGQAHNVIINDELKGLSSIPSHELVSRHIHKLVQVLGESLRLVTNYLNYEAIDTEILADEANEKEGETVFEATGVVEGDGAVTGGIAASRVIDEACMDVDHVEEVISAP